MSTEHAEALCMCLCLSLLCLLSQDTGAFPNRWTTVLRKYTCLMGADDTEGSERASRQAERRTREAVQ